MDVGTGNTYRLTSKPTTESKKIPTENLGVLAKFRSSGGELMHYFCWMVWVYNVGKFLNIYAT